MRFYWVVAFLFPSIIVSVADALKAANRLCTQPGGYRMVFPERTIKNYALVENVIMHGLDAVTLCFFVKDDPWDRSNQRQCAFSYAVPGEHNEFSFCTSPTLQVVIDGVRRKTQVRIEDGQLHHVCFTWQSSNGAYRFYKDGELAASGRGFKKGCTIQPRGTLVLGQDQDMLAGDFNVQEAFVGELSQVNVWDKVLSQSDIVTQHNKCSVDKGLVIWWEQLKNSVHGEVQVIEL